MRYQVLVVQGALSPTPGERQEVALEAAADEGVRALPEGTALLAVNRSRACTSG